MSNFIEIENIEELRLQKGIDDVELRIEIQQLRKGDFVRITFVAGQTFAETLLVRITSFRGLAIRGKLAEKPTSIHLAPLDVGLWLTFHSDHIHSVSKGQSNHDQ